jgi:hypothetical protein
VAPPDDDHDCGWRLYAKAQEVRLAEVEQKLADMMRLFAKKSERRTRVKLPPPLPVETDPAETKKKREDLAAIRAATLETEIVRVPVPAAARTCPSCEGRDLRAVGTGKSSTV